MTAKSKQKNFKQSAVGPIPVDWDVRPLSQDLEGLEAGVSVNSVNEQNQKAAHEVYILKTSAVANGRFIPSEIKKVAPKDINRVKTYPRADTIIFSRMNTPDLVGECGYVGQDYPNFFLPDRLWMTRFKRESRICVKWLNYLLNTPQYKVRIKSAATGTSGSMKNISKGALTSILLPWPEEEEQLSIAAALSDADALIAALDALIAKKRDLKQAAMQQLLTGKTRLPGFAPTAATCQQTEIGQIPSDWQLSTVGDEFEIQLGKMLDVDKNTGVLQPYLGNRAVQWDRIDVSDLPLVALTSSDMNCFRLRRGDLLVCEGGEVGRAAIWEAPLEECYFQKALHPLRPRRGFNS